jgi:23S rRNA maturation mini-RNase III
MALQDFLLKQAMKWKMKDVPKEQQEQIMALVQKDPELFKKIGEEVEKRAKNGESQMKATMEVMKKYRAELAALMQK